MFSAFTPLAGGNDFGTYNRPTEYPYDLDGSLDFMRPATGYALMPFPPTIGYISGLLPLMNAQETAMMFGKTPFGSWAPGGAYPNTGAMLSQVFPDLTGGLRKVKG